VLRPLVVIQYFAFQLISGRMSREMHSNALRAWGIRMENVKAFCNYDAPKPMSAINRIGPGMFRPRLQRLPHENNL
jgi:hypothetical protein